MRRPFYLNHPNQELSVILENSLENASLGDGLGQSPFCYTNGGDTSYRSSFEQDSLERTELDCAVPNMTHSSGAGSVNGYSFEQDSLERTELDSTVPSKILSSGAGSVHENSFEQDSLERTNLYRSGQDMTLCSMIDGDKSNRREYNGNHNVAILEESYSYGIDLDSPEEGNTSDELKKNTIERQKLEIELDSLIAESEKCAQTPGAQRLTRWGQRDAGNVGINIRYLDHDQSLSNETDSGIPSFSFPVYGIPTTPVPVAASTPKSEDCLEMEEDSVEGDRELDNILDSLEVALDMIEVDLDRIEILERAKSKDW